MVSRILTWAMLPLAVIASTAVPAEVRVVDGDTLQIDGQGYRINGIDAPEMGQRCVSPGGTWHWGKEAANFMYELVQGSRIECEMLSVDKYERIIARCSAGGLDLGEELVSAGLAWAYRRYSTEYIVQEGQAKSKLLGIWSAPNQPAWDFRAERWQKSAKETPYPGCPIKGNISENGHIYHTPWSPWYERTIVSEHKGERWFCNELEALRAGWRAPYWP